MALQITDASFDEVVLKSDKPVLVDFWATWCGPCRMLGPVIEELATEYEGRVVVGKVDVDNNQEKYPYRIGIQRRRSCRPPSRGCSKENLYRCLRFTSIIY